MATTASVIRVIPDVISELPQDEDSERSTAMEEGLSYGPPKSYGSTGTSAPIQVQEERKDSGYIHVYNSISKDQIMLEGKCDDRKRHLIQGCTCQCSTCGTCYKISLLLTLLLTTLFCIGFIVSEIIPKSYDGRTFIYEDSIILIETVDPFFYSSVEVEKLNDRQDHQLLVYFLPCESIIVEKEVISLNATFNSNVNVMLFPQDAVFLIEDSQLKMNYTILSSISSAQSPSFIISDDMHTLTEFKHNFYISDNVRSFNASKTSKELNTISYDFVRTGYYYFGFSPSGNTTLHVDYKLNGYSYVSPSSKPSCVLHTSSDTCSIKVPKSLMYSYGKDYCLLGEVVSSPYITDQVSVNIEYQVEDSGKWNIITISLLTAFLSLFVFNLILIVYWCVCYRAKTRNRRKYVSLQ